MKKAICLGAVVLSACGVPNSPEGKNSIEAETHRVATAVFEAFNNHDWAGMSALYSDSVRMQDPAYPGGKVGKHGMTDFYQSVPDIHDEVQNIFVQGNTAVVEFVSTGTIDNTQFSLPICCVLTVEDGLVVSDHTYYDSTH